MRNITIARRTIADFILSCRSATSAICWPRWRLRPRIRSAIWFICWISSRGPRRGWRQRLSSHHWNNALCVLAYPSESTQVAWKVYEKKIVKLALRYFPAKFNVWILKLLKTNALRVLAYPPAEYTKTIRQITVNCSCHESFDDLFEEQSRYYRFSSKAATWK